MCVCVYPFLFGLSFRQVTRCNIDLEKTRTYGSAENLCCDRKTIATKHWVSFHARRRWIKEISFYARLTCYDMIRKWLVGIPGPRCWTISRFRVRSFFFAVSTRSTFGGLNSRRWSRHNKCRKTGAACSAARKKSGKQSRVSLSLLLWCFLFLLCYPAWFPQPGIPAV